VKQILKTQEELRADSWRDQGCKPAVAEIKKSESQPPERLKVWTCYRRPVSCVCVCLQEVPGREGVPGTSYWAA